MHHLVTCIQNAHYVLFFSQKYIEEWLSIFRCSTILIFGPYSSDYSEGREGYCRGWTHRHHVHACALGHHRQVHCPPPPTSSHSGRQYPDGQTKRFVKPPARWLCEILPNHTTYVHSTDACSPCKRNAQLTQSSLSISFFMGTMV